jgi:hypothetical protein
VFFCKIYVSLSFYFLNFFKLALNVPRAGDPNPVLRLRQGYGACTLLPAGIIV